MKSQLREPHPESPPEPLTLRLYNDYVEKYGIERAQGFLDGIKAMNEQIADVFHINYPDGGSRPNSPSIVRTNLKGLYWDNETFLKAVKPENIEASSSENLTP